MRRDPKASLVFKYFNNMTFLCKKGSMSKTMDTDGLTIKTERPTTIPDDIEFSITQDDIDACEDGDEDDDIFVELSEEELALAFQQRNVSNSDSSTKNITADIIAPSVSIPILSQKRKAEPKDVSLAKISAEMDALPIDEQLVKEVLEPPKKHVKCNDVAQQIATTAQEPSVNKSEHRCEDSIFGELVAAMLQKMENTNKKSAKRKIMDILLDF